MNIQMLMKQANEMQRKMAKIEKELNEKEYSKSLGGGAINIKMMGNFSISNIEINEELLEPTNKEMLEEMLREGLNELITTAKNEKDQLMNGLTGGVKFPGAF